MDFSVVTIPVALLGGRLTAASAGARATGPLPTKGPGGLGISLGLGGSFSGGRGGLDTDQGGIVGEPEALLPGAEALRDLPTGSGPSPGSGTVDGAGDKRGCARR